eukprot:gene8340-17178_t
MTTCDPFKDKLKNTNNLAADVISDIFTKWQVDKFPSFLKSGSMPKQSWEFMKLKFKQKILAAEITKKQQNFSICFTGTSVTAGHDSPFNKSFGPLTGIIMSPVLKALNVHIDLRYAALGNNPCFPYDACVRTFCGPDTDLIHWEQSYSCGWDDDHSPTLEQFIRQSIVSPSHPIVIFSDSVTDNWEEKDCPNPIVPYVVTTGDKDMLRASVKTLATEINRNEYRIPQEITNAYRSAGLQHWFHTHYSSEYKCQGPYVKSWGGGVLKWHPSLSGHQLRADHHSYFWLSIWRDSVDDILHLRTAYSNLSLKCVFSDTLKHIESIITSNPMPAKPIFASNVTDRIQCLTDYEPRRSKRASIRSRIISGLKIGDGRGWNSSVLESRLGEDYTEIVLRHEAARYLDYKYIYIADHDAGPLSIRIQPKSNDVMYICEPTNLNSDTISEENHFWDLKPLIYITMNVKGKASFVFDAAKAKPISYFHMISTGGGDGEICIQTDKGVMPGRHVLTIVPTHPVGKILMLATLLIP